MKKLRCKMFGHKWRFILAPACYIFDWGKIDSPGEAKCDCCGKTTPINSIEIQPK